MTPQQLQQIEHCIFRETHDAFLVINPRDLKIVEINPAAQRLTRLRRQRLLEMRLAELFEADDARDLEAIIQACQTTTSTAGRDGYWILTEGAKTPVHITVSRIHTDPDPLALLTVRDMSERRRLEAERRQFEIQQQHAQKLESLGVMASGIAHDFNSVLTCILGFTLMADQQLPVGSPAKGLLQEVVSASHRATELIQQIVSYVGKSAVSPEAVNLSALTQEMVHLLTASVSRNCEVMQKLDQSLPLIQADPTQLRQVVMNLVINAAEAMEGRSGIIQVTTGTEYCTGDVLKAGVVNGELKEGDYVYLKVADAGSGMEADVLEKIFDPFYSTKMAGRGLGLAIVLGIVRGHRGGVFVQSAMGVGTTVCVRFPKPALPLLPKVVPADPPNDVHVGGTILVVDDDESICRLTSRILSSMGFAVKTAASGLEAIELFRADPGAIRLALIDCQLLHLDGAATLRELRHISPSIRAILTSGAGEPMSMNSIGHDPLTAFLHKPFRFDELQTTVLRLLEES